MTTTEELKEAQEDASFEMVDNGWGLELPTSHPATFSFTEPPEYAPDVLEDALDEHGFGVHERHTDYDTNAAFYHHVSIMTDHYKDVRVKITSNTARIYPTEDGVDTYEFSRIVHAIEDSFGGLTYDG